jgi:hypothetical protein
MSYEAARASNEEAVTDLPGKKAESNRAKDFKPDSVLRFWFGEFTLLMGEEVKEIEVGGS